MRFWLVSMIWACITSMSASVAWAGSTPNSVGSTVDDSIVLIDGRPSPSVMIYKFVRVDLKSMITEGDVISISQGNDNIKYGDGKWSQGHFFMRKIIKEGDYLLLESRLGGGMWGIVVTSCFGENAPLFHFENGQVNLIDRKILLNFVPPGAIVRKGYAAKILSENPEADAVEAINGAGIAEDIRTLRPLGYYRIVNADGSTEKCAKSGRIIAN